MHLFARRLVALYRVRFVIDVHAETYGAALAYANTIKAALQVAPFGGYVVDLAMAYEDVVGLHRAILDFDVWAAP